MPLSDIIDRCVARGLSVIALTDHNEIAGAQELQQIAPDWLTVIVGEEIKTAEGDVIGLYLKEKIEPNQTMDETIKQIKQQCGLVLLPHPFDRIRREAVGAKVADRIKDEIDAVEVFNSRCLWLADNWRSARFARQHDIVPFVGSDAHIRREYGQSVVSIARAPKGPADFMALLARARLIKKWSDPLVHGRTWAVKRRKRSETKPAAH